MLSRRDAAPAIRLLIRVATPLTTAASTGVNLDTSPLTDAALEKINGADEWDSRAWAVALSARWSPPFLVSDLVRSVSRWETSTLDACAKDGAPDFAKGVVEQVLHEVSQDAVGALLARQDELIQQWILRVVQDDRRRKFDAEHDKLTGLPNLDGLSEMLDEKWLRPRMNQTALLVWCDLDDFRDVNLTYGRAWGDYALQTVGRRLQASRRDGDVVARGLGASYVVVLHDVPPADRDALIDEVRNNVHQPVLVRGDEMVFETKVGVARFPEDGRDASSLLTAAETMAMDSAPIEVPRARVGYDRLLAEIVDIADVRARDVDLFTLD